ncbi:hypothetical protein HDV57DRAFT_165006 [Trichoderma longibrachiatum]
MCVGPVRGKWSGTGPGTGCEWRLALLHTHDEVYTRDCAAQTLEVSRQLLPHTLGFQSPSEGASSSSASTWRSASRSIIQRRGAEVHASSCSYVPTCAGQERNPTTHPFFALLLRMKVVQTSAIGHTSPMC